MKHKRTRTQKLQELCYRLSGRSEQSKITVEEMEKIFRRVRERDIYINQMVNAIRSVN